MSSTYTLNVELSVAELYILLGYSWLQAATTMPPVCSAHLRIAQGCKLALLESGQAEPVIQGKLQAIMQDLGIDLDPLQGAE